MRNLVILFLLISFISCRKDKTEPCNFILDKTGDTSLFISFAISNTNYIYYQKYSSSASCSESGLKLKSQHVLNTYYDVNFDTLGWDGSNNEFSPHPCVMLLFNDTIMVSSTGLELEVPKLSEILLDSYRFNSPERMKFPADLSNYDPEFFPCVSINLIIGNLRFSTDHLAYYFNYFKDSLNKYLWSKSNFNITSRKDVCNNLKLVIGEFNTIVRCVNDSKLYKIENGHFKILIK